MPLYFAYGSNLVEEQMKRRCPGSTTIGIGCLEGYRLAFTYYSSGWEGGVADVVPDPDQEVWGLIYNLTNEGLARLDQYEGYPDVYTRFKASIKTKTGLLNDIWVYTVVNRKDYVQPAKGYLERMEFAAGGLGFPENYILYLKGIGKNKTNI